MQNNTVKELREIAKQRGFMRISKLKKVELIELLREPTIDEKFLDTLDVEVDVIKYKDGDDWLETRKLGLGGSDIGSLLGVNKYKTSVDIWVDKVEGSSFQGNRFTYWGHRLEKIVAEEFSEQHTDFTVVELDKTLKRGYALANIDRLIYNPEKGYGILECKTTSAFNNKEWTGESVPESYYAQVMHYLAVTGLDYAYIACLIGGQDYKEFLIERNQDECEFILDKCKDFWENYVVTQVPPPADGSDAYTNYQKAKLGKLEEIEVEITDLDEKISKYKLIQEEIKEKEKEAELIKQKLLDEMIQKGGRKSITEKSKIVILSRNTNSIDKKALAEKYPGVSEAYKKAEEEFKTIKETRYLKIQ
ncbi:MAG: lambda-exonuclease family protein [Cetobacterium sp.]